MNGRVEIFWGDLSENDRQAFRKQLRLALRSMNRLSHWKEYTKKERLWSGQPTIRVYFNGRRVCKVTKGQPLPNPALLASKILQHDRFRRIRSFWNYIRAFVPALLFAIFPKCPICWTTYASVLTYFGVSFPYYSWLIWVFAGLGAINLGFSIHRVLRTGEYQQVMMQVTGYFLVLLNSLYFNQTVVAVLAIALLMASSLSLKIHRKPLHQFKIKLYGN